MRSKNLFSLILVVAIAPLVRTNAEDLLLAQAKPVIPGRPSKTPIHARISTNSLATNTVVVPGAPGAVQPSGTTARPTPPAFPSFPVPGAAAPSKSTLPGAAGVRAPAVNAAMQPGALVNPEDQ